MDDLGRALHKGTFEDKYLIGLGTFILPLYFDITYLYIWI